MHKMRAQNEARELVVMDRVAVLPETGIVIPGAVRAGRADRQAGL